MDLSEVFNESETFTAIDYTWEVSVFYNLWFLKTAKLVSDSGDWADGKPCFS